MTQALSPSPWAWPAVLRTIILPSVLAAIAGIALHRSLRLTVLTYGIAIGVAGGLAIALVPALLHRRRLIGSWLRRARFVGRSRSYRRSGTSWSCGCRPPGSAALL